jgi:cyclohexanecarboxyl-CoA dehydrogenase
MLHDELRMNPDTPEQDVFRRTIRRFAAERLADGYLERAKSSEFPWSVYREFCDLGLVSMLLPEEWGGPAVPDFIAAGIAIEEIAHADFNMANLLIPPVFLGPMLAEHASEAIRSQWLPRLTTGETYLAFGLTEPEMGSDAAALRCRATRTAVGYRLSGEKTAMTGLPSAEAAVVIARVEPHEGGPGGITAFLVPLTSAGASTQRFEDTGWRPLGRGSLALDGVEVSAEHRIGAEGAGFRTVMAGFDYTRPFLALTGIGAAQAAIDDAAAYVAERKAFGRALSRFEGVSFPLAEHLTKLAGARALCYETLRRRNTGEPHTALAAMCKWFGPRSAFEAAHDCLLLFGHYGYAKEYPHEQRLRDIMSVEIADGTAQIQKIVIAREILGPDFVPYRASGG